MKPLIADAVLAASHLIDVGHLYLTRANNEIALFNLLFSIAISSRPTTILELGTGPGVSSRAFFRALRYWEMADRKPRFLHTCDLDKASTDRVRARFGQSVVPHPVSTDELAAWWSLKKVPIDLLYIDADHSHAQSLADFDHFCRWVVPNGLILMHDSFPLSELHEEDRYSGHVWITVQEIKRNRADEFEACTIPHLCGVSILRRRGSKYF